MSRIRCAVWMIAALLIGASSARGVPRLRLTVREGDTLRRYHLERARWRLDRSLDLAAYPTKRMRYFRKMVRGPRGTVIVATDAQLLEVDASFTLRVRFRAPSGVTIGAFARFGSNWLVALGGRLLVLDRSFHEIAALRLLKSDHKSAHALLVNGTVAYVLDNIYQPIWAFRVGLANPRKPTVLQTIDFSGVNVHLSAQLVLRKRQLWTIVRDQSVLSGMSQQLFHYDLATTGAPRIGTQTLFSYSRRFRKLLRADWNRRLLALTPLGRLALIVTYGSGTVELARPTRVANELRFVKLGTIEKLSARWYSQALLSLDGRWAALYLEKTLMIWDLAKPDAPTLVSRTPWPAATLDLLLEKGR
ncbi:MAG: hypothetical protein KC609_09600 [Myxococcales bacterium]|nr:hypothetical protein [Myxococcales bacterium]